MNGTGFEEYANINGENANAQSPAVGDIDVKPLTAQMAIRYQQDTKHRKILTWWVMIVIPVWLIAVFVLVCICASSKWHLTDWALSTLLATTTVNILGLANIVLKGMFLKEEKNRQVNVNNV